MSGQPSLLAAARLMLAAARALPRHFDARLFADPARELLLDLFIAREEGGIVSADALCGQASMPTSAARVWLATLEDEGLIVRERPARCGQSPHVSLSLAAQARMAAYLGDVVELLRLPGGADLGVEPVERELDVRRHEPVHARLAERLKRRLEVRNGGFDRVQAVAPDSGGRVEP